MEARRDLRPNRHLTRRWPMPSPNSPNSPMSPMSPMSRDSFGAKGTLDVDGKSYGIYRLSSVAGEGLPDDAVDSLPYSLKILLENLLRTEDGANITAADIRALAGWDANSEPQGDPVHARARDHAGLHRCSLC